MIRLQDNQYNTDDSLLTQEEDTTKDYDTYNDFETTDVSDNTTSNTTGENQSAGGKKPLQFQIDNAIGDTMIV